MDITASFVPTTAVSDFGVSVLSGAVNLTVDRVDRLESGFAVSVHVEAPPWVNHPTPAMNTTIKVAAGETVDLRVFVDRMIVEVRSFV